MTTELEHAATVDAMRLTFDLEREVTSLRHAVANLELSCAGAMARGVTFGARATRIADALRAANEEMQGASAIVRDAMRDVNEAREAELAWRLATRLRP